MIAFHNTSVAKPQILKQLRAHVKADALVGQRRQTAGVKS